MRQIKEHLPLIAVITVAAVMLLPWLGLTDFNTKGEPREAVVALSMIKDGDWILPVNNGMDIPYKPPFFHYCIAVLALVTGSVSEYTSRLPSALALMALAVACFAFYRRRWSTSVALTGSILLLTAFEVHRAGVNCRVDMVLTAFTVGAMLLLYRWWERGRKGIPLMAILCMSCATLTKGPVGFVLPCFVMGVFTLLRGGKFWKTFATYAVFGILSCILPAIWYVAAWHEGGQHFLDLVYEENIGRMTGTMSYDSHVHAFPYNFLTLAMGWLPWTLLLLFSLAALPWRLWIEKTKSLTGRTSGNNLPTDDKTIGKDNGKTDSVGRLTRLRVRIMEIPPVRLFTWLGFVLVLFFYCLPSSKRSVYLLPCYPFMAMLIAEYIDWLWQRGSRRVLRAYVVLIASLSIIITVVFVAVRLQLVPDTIFHGKHAAENIAMLHTLSFMPMGLMATLLAALPLVVSVDALQMVFRKRTAGSKASVKFALLAPVVVLMTALDGVYQPAVLNTKSLRPMAVTISRMFPGEPFYQYIASPMMHFFGADFYLGDRLDQFEKTVYTTSTDGRVVESVRLPERGVLIVPESDFEELAARHRDYRFCLVHTTGRGSSEVKTPVCFYRFKRN